MTDALRTSLRRSRVLTTWALCAVLVVVAGRASSSLYESMRSTGGSESETQTVSVGESELLHAENSQRRSVPQRCRRAIPGERATKGDSRPAVRRTPDHWSVLQTNQFNAIGCPLLC
ncbi:MAG TPA: hypothetical protein P5081_01010 [Phycisphaerae bacterium]|nr:hypothetical protein [Phycisphaerae bacterium]HRW51432.1 hypothetical protein [Phycisphaerae bacterium]